MSTLKKKRNEKIVKLYKNGISTVDIAEQFNITRNRVYGILRRYGVNTNVKGKGIEKERNKEIMELHNKGFINKEIAYLLDMSERKVHDTVYYYKLKSKRSEI